MKKREITINDGEQVTVIFAKENHKQKIVLTNTDVFAIYMCDADVDVVHSDICELLDAKEAKEALE